MEVATYFSSSCAGSAISGLSLHTGPVDAMLSFCKKELVCASFGVKRYTTLTPFYAFVAGPEVPCDQPGGSGHSSRTWTRYGTEFAEYIQQEKLGIIVTPGPKVNLKYHPDTKCQFWIWSPDQEAVQNWYETKKPVEPVVTATPKKEFDYPNVPRAAVPARGMWDRARGVADGKYKCGHCKKLYVAGERIWLNQNDGGYYCEAYGLEAEAKGVKRDGW